MCNKRVQLLTHFVLALQVWVRILVLSVFVGCCFWSPTGIAHWPDVPAVKLNKKIVSLLVLCVTRIWHEWLFIGPENILPKRVSFLWELYENTFSFVSQARQIDLWSSHATKALPFILGLRLVARWTTEHYNLSSNLSVGMSAGRFISDFDSFGGHSAHLADRVHKNGRKTSIVFILGLEWRD